MSEEFNIDNWQIKSITVAGPTITIDNGEFGKYHYELYDAAQAGNIDVFMKYSKYATTNDLEWCLEVVSSIDILKYIVEVKKVTGFIQSCYHNAIDNGYKEIQTYLDESPLITKIYLEDV